MTNKNAQKISSKRVGFKKTFKKAYNDHVANLEDLSKIYEVEEVEYDE